MVFRKLHGVKPKKCHYMCISRNSQNDKLEFDNWLLENSKEVVLGVTIDNKLNWIVTLKKFVEKPAKTNYLNSSQRKSIFLAE